MIILANSFGVCHILLVFFFFFFFFFLVWSHDWVRAPVEDKTQSTHSCVQGHWSVHSAVIFHRRTSPKSGKDPIWYILRNFKNATFYVDCFLYWVDLMMFPIQYFILLHDKQQLTVKRILLRPFILTYHDVSHFQYYVYGIRTVKSMWKQTVIVDGQTSYQSEKHKMYRKLSFITSPSRSVSLLTSR